MSFGTIPLSPDDKPDGFVLLSMYEKLELENSKLRELALGLKWCSENYGCKDVCPLYGKSEPEHCREERLPEEAYARAGNQGGQVSDFITNAELRIEAERLCDENERLEAENAKLRGLMADLLPFAYIGMEDACPTSGCFLFEECRYSISPDCDVEERMLERLREAGIEANMRELGVEVDG